MTQFLARRAWPFWLFLGLALVAAVGSLEFSTDPNLSFALFYLVPITLGALFAGRAVGAVLSTASALTWHFADTLTGSAQTHAYVASWNLLIRLGVFLAFVWLAAAQRATLARVYGLSRIDPLTGALNRLAFFEGLEHERLRSGRSHQPFTLVYLDLDNFKAVNDRWGHAAGDQVLLAVVATLRQSLRGSDLIARLGGDEFALLLPQTGGQEARTAVEKAQSGLAVTMTLHHWPVTFSIGVLTCRGDRLAAEAMVARVDVLMYEVKAGTKDGVRYIDLYGD